jgi:hypothetical protein
MTLRLTPDMLAAGYDFLRMTGVAWSTFPAHGGDSVCRSWF